MEKIDDIIESVRADDCHKPNLTLRKLRIVLKVFGKYSTTAETLPPATLIPVCLFTVPVALHKLLDLEEGETLYEVPEKASLRLCLHLYLRGLVRLLGECEEEIKHVVVESMYKSILLTPAFPSLSRKWVRSLVQVWAQASSNLNLALRCFLAVGRLLRSSDRDVMLWGLRRVYVGYFQHCGQVTWRSLEHINFMGNCFCELVNINPDTAYYVLFGYLRSLVVQVASLNQLKGKEKVALTKKLYSQQTLQVIRLFGQIIGKSGEQTLSALAYPFAELINAYERISQSPQYIPLKLHLVQAELQCMEDTGLYFPHALQALLKILRASPLQKKLSKKAVVEGSIELGYHLSAEELKNTNYINDIFRKATYYLYWLQHLACTNVACVELSLVMARKISEVEFTYGGYKREIKEITRVFREDADKLYELRGKRKMVLGAISNDKFQKYTSGLKIELAGRQKYTQLKEEYQAMLRAKLAAQQEEQQPQQADSGMEERQQVDSGWEEASEGASDFDDAEEGKFQDSEASSEQLESISYEGDPEDPEQAVKQWSEEEWSSQEELEQ